MLPIGSHVKKVKVPKVLWASPSCSQSPGRGVRPLSAQFPCFSPLWAGRWAGGSTLSHMSTQERESFHTHPHVTWGGARSRGHSDERSVCYHCHRCSHG